MPENVDDRWQEERRRLRRQLAQAEQAGSADALARILADDAVAAVRSQLMPPAGLVAMLDAIAILLHQRCGDDGFLPACIDALHPHTCAAHVARGLMIHLLEEPETRAWRANVATMLVDLHRIEDREPDWAAARTIVLAVADEAANSQQRRIAELWEVAAWPAHSGRSVLISALRTWDMLELYADHWSHARQQPANDLLKAIWDEEEEHRSAGDSPNYAALFRSRDGDLHRGFERNLAWTNQRNVDRLETLACRCLGLLTAS